MRPRRLGTLPADLVDRLEQFRSARGLSSPSEALRVLIREVDVGGETAAATGDPEEILRLATAKARAGSVPAMRLLLEEQRRTIAAERPRSAIDELTKRRSVKVTR